VATFEFGGNEITVIRSETLDIGELVFIRDSFGINGLSPLDAGLENLEPDAVRALLVAAIRRVDPDVDPWAEELDGIVVRPLVTEMTREAIDSLAAAEGDEL
jgi:hypothetical protein